MSVLKRWLGALQLPLFEDEPAPLESAAKLRSVVLNGQVVPYVIERTRRKTVGMVIDSQGLRVRASASVSVSEIERILRSKTSWLLRNIQKQKAIQKPVSFVPELALEDGALLSFLGRDVRVVWLETAPTFNAAEFWQYAPEQLILKNVAPEQRAQAVLDVVTDVLLVYLNERAQYYAQHFGIRYRGILLSSAKTLWGTCRTDGVIRINWRLAFVPLDLADYVLAHELAHTVHMNHSARFWGQVETMCPDYKERIKAIRKYNLRAT